MEEKLPRNKPSRKPLTYEVFDSEVHLNDAKRTIMAEIFLDLLCECSGLKWVVTRNNTPSEFNLSPMVSTHRRKNMSIDYGIDWAYYYELAKKGKPVPPAIRTHGYFFIYQDALREGKVPPVEAIRDYEPSYQFQPSMLLTAISLQDHILGAFPEDILVALEGNHIHMMFIPKLGTYLYSLIHVRIFHANTVSADAKRRLRVWGED